MERRVSDTRIVRAILAGVISAFYGSLLVFRPPQSWYCVDVYMELRLYDHHIWMKLHSVKQNGEWFNRIHWKFQFLKILKVHIVFFFGIGDYFPVYLPPIFCLKFFCYLRITTVLHLLGIFVLIIVVFL